MKRLGDLSGPARRQHRRLLRWVRARGDVFVRGESLFRRVERLHRAGLVTAVASRPNWGTGRRSFRELHVFASDAAARRHYRYVLPRKGDRR